MDRAEPTAKPEGLAGLLCSAGKIVLEVAVEEQNSAFGWTWMLSAIP